MEKGRLHFKTAAAANLFAVEITGQISDGAWENSRPLDHWKFWCDAEVVVDGRIGHEGRPSKTNYNVSSLKKYVKDYMLDAIRITKMPWFDMSWTEYSRGLTDGYLLRSEDYHSLWFSTPKKRTEEEIEKSYGSLCESRASKAAEALGRHTSPEMKQALYKEALRQMVQEEEQCWRGKQEWMDACQEKLATIGIKSEADLKKTIAEIRAVPVTDQELDAALAEVKLMLQTAC